MIKKDVGMRIRIERKLRDEFLVACQVQGRPAAQVIREFMRAYVKEDAARPYDSKESQVILR